jgi:hypothetical protein
VEEDASRDWDEPIILRARRCGGRREFLIETNREAMYYPFVLRLCKVCLVEGLRFSDLL